MCDDEHGTVMPGAQCDDSAVRLRQVACCGDQKSAQAGYLGIVSVCSCLAGRLSEAKSKPL